MVHENSVPLLAATRKTWKNRFFLLSAMDTRWSSEISMSLVSELAEGIVHKVTPDAVGRVPLPPISLGPLARTCALAFELVVVAL